MKTLSNLKRLIGAMLLVSVLLCTTSCIAPVCYHNWVDASCESAKYCTICGITTGKALVHVGGDATCDSLPTCKHCGKQYGEYDAHSFDNKQISENTDDTMHYFLCKVCGTSSAGEAHTWNVETASYADAKYCTVCSYVAEEAIAHDHIGGEVDCESGAVCELCNKEYTDPLGHVFEYDEENPNWTTASEKKHYHNCTVCGDVDEGETHEWIVEGDEMKCSICGFTLPESDDGDEE